MPPPGLDVSAQAGGFCNPLDGDTEGGQPQGYSLKLREGGDAVVRLNQPGGEAPVDLGLVPPELLDILGPLEVADDYAAGVGQNIGDHEYNTIWRVVSSTPWTTGSMGTPAFLYSSEYLSARAQK